MLEVNRTTSKQLLENISEEDSMFRGKDQRNHIRWLAGHMFYCNSEVLTFLGDKDDDYKKSEKLFAYGSQISDDASSYPSLAELKEKLNSVYEKAAKLIESAADGDLEKEVGEGENKRTLWQMLTGYFMHDYYHMGQITNISRALGRDRPFG